MAISLRPYQQEAVKAVINEWDSGNLSTMIAMSTGTGKTECALGVLAEEFRTKRASRVLAIAHRRELIYQPRDRVIANWQDVLPIPGVVMGNEDECDSQFVVATIQTLIASGGKRLRKMLLYGGFSHVWVDETHRIISPSFFRVFANLFVSNPELKLLGATATPQRTDKQGLRQVFDSIAHSIDIKQAIALQALAPLQGLKFELPVDISSVKETEDGWDDEEVGRLLSFANIEEIIIHHWKEHAADRQTIAFTASVMQAHSLARAFRKAGVSAEAIDGKTPTAQRDSILKKYLAGEIQLLANHNVLTEGFDAPATSCALMARPTKSDLVYIQAIGRALRLHPGKENALILDFAPLGARNICLSGDLLGEIQEEKETEKDKTEKSKDSFGINRFGKYVYGNPEEVKAQILDLLERSRLAWVFDGQLATVSIAEKTSLVVVLPQQERIARAEELRVSGKWSEAWETEYRKITGYQVFAVVGSRATSLGVGQTWEDASLIASNYADAHAEDWCSKKKSRWRNSPASEKQEQYCRVLGIWREGMTRGVAGQAITHAKVLGALKAQRVLR